MARPPARATRQSGATLIEALVVLALFATGMVKLAQLQTGYAAWTEDSRLRAEAARYARQKLDELRAYAQVPSALGVSSFEGDVVSSLSSERLSAGTATFHRSWTAQGDAAARYRVVIVTLRWEDRNGAQSLKLPSLIARHPPNAVGRLMLPANHDITPSLPLTSAP